MVLYLKTQSCLGIPEISGNNRNFGLTQNIRKYQNLRVYPKYRILPDISGNLLPDDFQNWTGSGRVLTKILGSRVPVVHCSLYSSKSSGSCRGWYKSIFTLWRTTFLSRLCISLSWRKALTQSVLPAALSPIISQCDPHFTHSQHPKAELCSAQQTTYKHKHKNEHKH